MAIRSTQFALRSLNTVAGQVLYTVPAGQRALIKWASIVSFAAVPGRVVVGLLTPVFNVASIIDVPAGVQGRLETVAECYAVLNEGEQLFSQVGSITGGGYWVSAGGVLFDL